ncbi:MAG: hypothetical protein ACOVLC_09555 [Flavobacterium sp.]
MNPKSKKLMADILAGLIIYGFLSCVIVYFFGKDMEGKISFIIFFTIFMTIWEMTGSRKLKAYIEKMNEKSDKHEN